MDKVIDYLNDQQERMNISYAMIMLKLQELCGLSYREARAHIIDYWETPEKMAEDLGITVASVRRSQNRAAWKVKNSGYKIDDIAGKYDDILYRFIDPNDVATIIAARKAPWRHTKK